MPAQNKSIDAVTLRELKQRIGQTAGPVFPVSLSAGTLELLIDGYMERAALIVVNDQMEKQGAEIAPYWAHHMMARACKSTPCTRGSDTCRSSSLCITEYCVGCYARVWWDSQSGHKQRHRDGMPGRSL